MPGFTISKPYTMPREDVREAAEGLAKRLEQEHGVNCSWDGDCVRLKGAGVKGELDFNGNTLDVAVQLGMLAAPFLGVLKKEVQKYLDEHVD